MFGKRSMCSASSAWITATAHWRIHRWCGGFQDCHLPVTIGWRAQVGNRLSHGVVLVEYHADSTLTTSEDIEKAINKAKVLASKALVQLGMR